MILLAIVGETVNPMLQGEWDASSVEVRNWRELENPRVCFDFFKQHESLFRKESELGCVGGSPSGARFVGER